MWLASPSQHTDTQTDTWAMEGIWLRNLGSSVGSPLTASAIDTRCTRELKMPRLEITCEERVGGWVER